jgi:hypothetical protein
MLSAGLRQEVKPYPVLTTVLLPQSRAVRTDIRSHSRYGSSCGANKKAGYAACSDAISITKR